MVLAPLLLALTATGSDDAWTYQVEHVGAEAAQLVIEARFPQGSGIGLEVGEPDFIRARQVHEGGQWRATSGLGRVDCKSGCRVRYHFRLGESADQIRGAERSGAFIATRPGHWLVRPKVRPPPHRAYRLQVRTSPGATFVSGLERDDRGDYVGAAVHIGSAPQAAFGPLDLATVNVAGATLTVASPRGALRSRRGAILKWVRDNAGAVAAYFGEFPVPHALVLLVPVSGDRIPFGTAQGFGGAAVKMYFGTQTSADTLAKDWKLRHELVHLGLPNLHSRHRWMEEGLATYLETVLDARAQRIDQTEFWIEMVEGIEQGLPRGEGFDGTGRWGETYWGGALFWLTADVHIRIATKGAKGLPDALRSLRTAGGTIKEQWSVTRTLKEADAGLPRPVLTELYDRFGRRGTRVNLPRFLRHLGVRTRAFAGAQFDDRAVWAQYRRDLIAWPSPQTASPAGRRK